ncbi:hypothetical protein EHS25_005807 [Saitozyma podzolica]|uniref:Short-chain dehydrogenase n=1 Tax=Saitozyma podzolica TaxID=1890683 RepID=A0A427XVI7_9TREE|nr:hypothetical protein EHS25_005807 [Saitozyma podzolica]
MPSVLITGSNRGIGLGLAKAYLEQGYTVIGAVREPSKQPPLEGLITVKIDAESDTDPFEAITSLKSRGITTLDLVIANAGVGGEMTPFTSIGAESLLDTMRVNTIAPLLLFQAALPLIPKGGKFVVVSTMMALTEGEMYHQAGQDAYRLSKHAVNFIARTLHFEHPDLTIFTISPGWVDTDMGSWGAAQRGMSSPPQKLSDTLPKIAATITAATRERESGRMVDYDGSLAGY